MADDWRPVARQPVPWRWIFAVILAVLATGLGIVLLVKLARIVAYLVVALFLAAVLTPPVDFLQQRGRMRRGFATMAVFLTVVVLLGAMLYAFIRPIVDQAQTFADDLPGYVDDAKNGKGTIGHLVKKYKIDEYVNKNQDKLQEQVRNLGTPALGVVKKVFTTLFATVTILVLTVLILLQGPILTTGVLSLLPDRHRERARRVAIEAGRAVSGYVFGNLLISVIAGTTTWIVLALLGVPYAGVLGLWVGFTDLIPLVGATLGAIPTIAIAFLHSVPAGIAATIFFILYQQFENHVLQVSIMSRTVKVNPLAVLVSVLFGVELFGLFGALLAIPGAGVIQVISRDLYQHRHGRLGGASDADADTTVDADVSDPDVTSPA